MGIEVFLRRHKTSIEFSDAASVGWTSRQVEVLRYGKVMAHTEKWLLLFADEEGKTIVAQFKDDDVAGFTYYSIRPEDARLQSFVDSMKELLPDLQDRGSYS